MFGSNYVAVGPVYLSVFLRSVSQKGGSSGQTPGHFLEARGISGILIYIKIVVSIFFSITPM